MKHLYFVRHGLSEMNVRRERSGTSDSPLMPKGHDQAKAAGQQARKQGLAFDIIVSSPLQRAHDTAKHIATHMDYAHDKIILDERLMERHFGELEGKVDSPDITEGLKNNESHIDGFQDVESALNFQERADEVMAYLASLPHETILVVSHGAFGRAMYRSINNIHYNEKPVFYANAEVIKLI